MNNTLKLLFFGASFTVVFLLFKLNINASDDSIPLLNYKFQHLNKAKVDEVTKTIGEKADQKVIDDAKIKIKDIKENVMFNFYKENLYDGGVINPFYEAEILPSLKKLEELEVIAKVEPENSIKSDEILKKYFEKNKDEKNKDEKNKDEKNKDETSSGKKSADKVVDLSTITLIDLVDKNTEVKKLSEDYEDAKKTLTETEKKLTETKDKITDAEKKLTETEKELTKTKGELVTANATIKTKENLNKSIVESSTKLKKENSEKIKKLEEEKKESDKEVVKLKKENKEKIDKLSELLKKVVVGLSEDEAKAIFDDIKELFKP